VVREGEPAVVNQAQMELGAMVCTPADPRCERCPLHEICVARRDGIVERLPELAKQRETVALECTVLLVRRGDEVLLRRRRPDELLPGMWDLPGAFTGIQGDRSSDLPAANALLPLTVTPGAVLGRIKHAITYRRITLDVHEVAVEEGSDRSLVGTDGAELLWCTASAALSKALSSPARRALRRWGRPPAGAPLDTPEPARVS
jgi:A/G-specific adenine glycosylase